MSQVLIVCSANRMRSPIGEAFLKRELDALGSGWEVSSAGFAPGGSPVFDEVLDLMRSDYGIDLSDFRSRQLSPLLVDQMELVLTMERRQVEDLVAVIPEAKDRTFAVNEFLGHTKGDIVAPPAGAHAAIVSCAQELAEAMKGVAGALKSVS